ncbi:MAG: aliphatic sulfonate ABC transporter substrate-binding protein [Gracilibacter sp. BRH_c7a]|nr:MAG: aliphatic sulfonate ABC transporter substrate-binding protein [Gracilibacter sp. BRH_c7a]
MKQMKKVFTLILISVFLLVTILTGCSAEVPEPEKPKVINISYSLRPINVPTIVALQKKIFEEEFAKAGIEIKWYELEGPATTEALAAKSIDIATSLNYVSAIITKANGNDIKIISSYSKFPEAIGLLAGVDSGISSVSDLKGKKVALQKGTMLHEMLIRALENSNLSTDDVEVINMPSPDAANALLQQHVDAAILPDPIMANVISSQKAKLIITAEDIILGQAVVAARTEFLTNYPEIVKRFLEVHNQTLDWAENNMDESLKMASNVNEINIKAVKMLSPKFDFSLGIDNDNIAMLKQSASFLQDNDFIKVDANTETLIDNLVDTSFLP